MKIISFLRTISNENKLKEVSYLADKCGDLVKSGEFITSSDALSYANPNANFVFLGSKTEIKNLKNRFINLPKNYICKEISNNYSEVFKEILANFDDENIVLDITHASRDISFISPLAGLLSSSIKAKNFTLIHAKPIQNQDGFEFVRLDEYSEIMKFAFVLISFKQFIKVPFLGIENNSLYETLKNFSGDFLSNQIYKCKDNFDKFKNELLQAKIENLSFLSEFIDEILNEWDEFFKKLNSKKGYEVYFLVAKKMYEKDYFLNSSNFLIEAIPQYIFENLKEYLSYKIFDKNVSDFCNKFISNGEILQKYDKQEYYLRLPFEYFYDLNSAIFKELYSFRKEIGEIRHILAHIGQENLENVKERLQTLLNKFEKMILNDEILSKLDFDENKVKNLSAYHFDCFVDEIKQKTNLNFKNITIKSYLSDYLDKNVKNLSANYTKFYDYIDKNLQKVTLIYKNYKNYKENGEIYFNEKLQ